MRRAALCSHLAKLVRGQPKKKLYRLKNENIRSALKTKSALVEVACDWDRHFGLLSIRLHGTDGVRVHTHENWINAA